MNRWLQRRLYQCPRCRTWYLHDRAYPHAVYACPARPMTPVVMVAVTVSGRSEAER